MEGAAELVKTLERFPQVASVEAASDGIRVFSQGTDGLLPQIVQAAHPWEYLNHLRRCRWRC